MRAALCFDGVEDEALVESAKEFLAAFAPLEAWCAYGDAAERVFQTALERHHGRQPPHPGPAHPGPDGEQAAAIAGRGVGLLRRAGADATARTLGGRDAGHALAEASSGEILLIIAAGHRAESGPKSLGHVARFVIDHAGGPVLVLRLPR